jgi:putative heme transporter
VAKLRLRDCNEHPRQLRASRRSSTPHELDRHLHSLWARLPIRALRRIATGLLLAVAGYGLIAARKPIFSAMSDLSRANLAFLGIALAAEVASVACYVAMFVVLLRRSPVAVPTRTIVSLTVIGIAMLNSLPGGQGIATIYWYQQLTRRQVQRSVVALALLVTTVIEIATLPVIASAGLIFGGSGYGADVRIPLFTVSALIITVTVVFRRHLLPVALWMLRKLKVDTRDVPATGQHVLALFALGLLNWLFDAGALLAALAALGVSLPLRDVIISYSLGQLVSTIPILPGGGGSVEATMVAGLVVAGGATAIVVAAVIVYRIIGAWGFVPIGWFLWLIAPKSRAEPQPALPLVAS